MKNNFIYSFFIAFSLLSLTFDATGQITPNGNSGSSMTNYTSGATNDPIYIWCADGLANNTASLTANAPSGTGPFTFNWFFHDQSNFSWSSYTTQTGTSSTINNLPSDGYRVQIYDAGNNLVGCYIAWVWNMNSDVTASNAPSACDATGLNGTVDVNGSFTYYNPPPPESIITPATTVTVCFTATHTYVSDLGFYLIGPAACGSPVVMLMPHPQLINASNGCCCNSGNNVNNLCFTTTLVGNISPCTAGVPLTGTYSGYSSSYGDNVTTNWAPIYGCNAAEGGWRVQIFDCIGGDVGSLTNATLTFSNLTSFCGSPTSITYSSGAINSVINDNSCAQGTASIFQVPITPNLTTPITINANVSYLWTANPAATIPNASTSLTPSVSGLSTGTTDFTLTATISYEATVCTNDATTAFVQTCCTAVANAGGDVAFCSGSNATIGTPAVVNMTYSWTPTAGLSDPTAAQPTVTLTNTGTAPQNTTYTLTVTNVSEGGCTDSDDVTVSVTQIPTLSISNDASICEGDCIDLTVSGADYYSWDSSTGITDTTASTVNVCPTQTTTYNVTGYVVGANAVPNGDFSAGATNFSSDYVLNSDTQSEGTYFVTTNANLTHPGFTGVDHTTGSGNFMVVNGAASPNTSVWCQTVSVEPNTEYSFSTWVSTLAIGSPAVLQFSINGTNISNPFTAPASTGVWDEFYAVWNSGASTSATICIINQNTSAGGNDFGLDDIFFANICSSTESVTISVNPPADATITPQSPVCEDNGTVTFSAAQSGGTWSGTGITDGTNGTFDPSVSGAGTFDITYTIPGSCGDQDMVQIVVNPLPTADAGIDQVVCAGEQVTLVGSGASTLAWSNSVQDGIAFTPSASLTYTLTATDDNGCVDQDQVTVTVNPLPNVNAGLDLTVCDGADVTLSASGASSYTWNNGVVDGQTFVPTPGTTTYTVTGTDANGCTNSDDVDVNVTTYPVVDVNADVQVGYPTLQVNFNDLSSGGDTYFWDFGNGQTDVVSVPTNQTMSYGSVGVFTMELTISNGSCQVSDTIMITVNPFPAPLIHVPNIFTPNQDGSNDEFFLETEFVSELNVIIINRWGNTVAEITTPQGSWDGTIDGNAADDGVYFFRYEATGINGDVLTGHGNITLVR